MQISGAGFLYFLLFVSFFEQSPSPTILAIVLSSVLVYLLTSTKYLNHLGESYRYLEYNLLILLPLFLASSAIVNEGIMISSILQLVYCLLISILVGIFLRHKKLPDHDLLEDFLKVSEIDEKSVVFPVSMRLGADICARVNCKSFLVATGKCYPRNI